MINYRICPHHLAMSYRLHSKIVHHLSAWHTAANCFVDKQQIQLSFKNVILYSPFGARPIQ